MKKFLLSLILISCFFTGHSQEKKDSEATSDALLKELSAQVCQCIDSITIIGRRKKAIAGDISRCIEEKAGAYQMGSKLTKLNLDDAKENGNDKKEINISININTDSDEYKKYYYEMERYLMANCEAMKTAMATNNQLGDKSLSSNPKAMEYYDKAIAETKKENYKGAVDYYKKAVKVDPKFAFAYDNMGICYRRLNDYDNAIASYQKSLEIDPEGTMPLQNIAVAYQYKKQYQKAIEAYSKLAELDANDPEIFYGIGQIYALYLNENEKGLDNMCKAYNLYVEHKSPYRTDAEKIINIIYGNMKQQGKEAKFNEILKNNKISPN